MIKTPTTPAARSRAASFETQFPLEGFETKKPPTSIGDCVLDASTVGSYVLGLRLSKNLSRPECALQLRMDIDSFRRLEDGHVSMSLKELYEIKLILT